MWLLIVIACFGAAEAQHRRIAFAAGGLHVVDPTPGSIPEMIVGENIIVDGRMLHYPGSPEWSPDGSKIVFLNYSNLDPTDIWVVNADGSNLREVLRHPQGVEIRVYRDPVWSPDGSRIAYRKYYYSNLVIMNSDGTQRTNLETRVLGFDWAPDGRFVYSGADEDHGLYLASVDEEEIHGI